jgi:hypothetical protein
MDKKEYEVVLDTMISLWYLKGWSEATNYIDMLYGEQKINNDQYLALNDRVNTLGQEER